MPEWIYKVTPPRADFVETMSDAEDELVSAHFSYLEELAEEGVVMMAGRRADATYGLVIFNAEDEDEAREIAAADPAVKAGLFASEVFEFHIALWSNVIDEDEDEDEDEEN